MHISFIIFIVLVIVVVAIAGFFLGRAVSKSTRRESSAAKNNTPYEDCVARNVAKFNYGTFTDNRDGETYHTIKIGNQVWMAENLRYKAEGSFAPDNDESKVKKFGRLYTWASALNIPEEFNEKSPAKDIEMYRQMRESDYRGLAPEGWHIPSNKEWEELLGNIDPKSNGCELRSACVWRNAGEDSLGFFALPAGYRFGNGSFCHFGDRARFWSKDEYGYANAFRLSLTEESVDIEGVYRSDAISIRCVKN